MNHKFFYTLATFAGLMIGLAASSVLLSLAAYAMLME
jgi:hypothetical protein